ncbi:ATPase [Thermococcus profundus]|uniref:non-specific serine/threonine protein kinase n=1 Tax=Thermococcus profundus TaxID=49899 RepID=A0A2Z2M8L9_THEPR|nr:ATPase domain-containing protein [Thermococcus profundus]ASJ02637.1 ATPase [Thermococcus profundus]
MNLIPTGIPSLDGALSGGFPRGSTILLAGNPGSGKTHLAVHILYNNMRRGLRGVYVSFAETKKQFYRNAHQSGIDLSKMEEAGLFKFYDMLTVPRDELEGMIAYLISDIVEFKPDIIVFDSVTVFGQMFGEAHLRSFLHSVIGRIVNALDSLAILIDEIPYGERRVGFGLEEFVVDGVIVLEMERMGEVIRRYLTIPKMRGRPLRRSAYEYVITEDGLEVLAIPELEFAEPEVLRSRLDTGVPGLDELLGGGLYEGSITLIAGPTGSGKTIMALNLASNLASSGKKVLYIAYEESLAALRDTLEKLGLKENFKIVSMIPEGRTPVEYYALIKGLVEKEGFDVLVIDSLSAMQTHMDKKEFIKAVRYLQLLTKEKGITFILTYITGGAYQLTSTGFSTLSDNLIFLTYEVPEKVGESLKRHILVLKARRSKNDPTLKNFIIGEGGIRIE